MSICPKVPRVWSTALLNVVSYRALNSPLEAAVQGINPTSSHLCPSRTCSYGVCGWYRLTHTLLTFDFYSLCLLFTVKLLWHPWVIVDFPVSINLQLTIMQQITLQPHCLASQISDAFSLCLCILWCMMWNFLFLRCGWKVNYMWNPIDLFIVSLIW